MKYETFDKSRKLRLKDRKVWQQNKYNGTRKHNLSKNYSGHICICYFFILCFLRYFFWNFSKFIKSNFPKFENSLKFKEGDNFSDVFFNLRLPECLKIKKFCYLGVNLRRLDNNLRVKVVLYCIYCFISLLMSAV